MFVSVPARLPTHHQPLVSGYGALRYNSPANSQWKSDIETICDESSDRYILHLEPPIIDRYRIESSGGPSGEFYAWSMILHCFAIKKAKDNIKYVDWENMETDLRVPAEKVVQKEILHLNKKAGLQQGIERMETLERIEHRKVILLLGKIVVLSKRNLLEQYVVMEEGILGDFTDNYIFVGGGSHRVDEEDLATKAWTVEGKEENKSKERSEEGGEEEKKTEGSQTGELGNEEWSEVGDEEKKGKKKKKEEEKKEMTMSEFIEWMGGCTVEEKNAFVEAAKRIGGEVSAN